MAKKPKAVKPLTLLEAANLLRNIADTAASVIHKLDPEEAKRFKKDGDLIRAAIAAHEKNPPGVRISIYGGNVQSEECFGGAWVEVLDYDNCSECGGKDCEGGWKKDEVHAKVWVPCVCGTSSRRKDQGAKKGWKCPKCPA